MQYISINQLVNSVEVHPFEEKEMFIRKVMEHKLSQWSEKELVDFVNLQTQQTSIFNSWIEQHEELEELLISGKVSKPFKDKLKWKQHQLFTNFQKYVSHFFDLKLTQNKTEFTFENWSNVFSFFELMTKDQCFYIEQKCYDQVKDKLDIEFNSIKNQLDGRLFESKFNALLCDSVLEIHSFLSPNSNTLKIEFIERVFVLFKHPFCTAKLANWVLLQLQKMKLNQQQLESLAGIKSSIKTGEYAFKESVQVQEKSVTKSTLVFGFLAISLIAFLFFVFNYDFSMKPEFIHEGSALKYFSVKERKEIDSVIRSMDSIPKLESDPSYYGSGLSVYVRQAFENSIAEKLYSDLETDRDLHYAAVYDTSLSLDLTEQKKSTLRNTSILTNRKAANTIELKNGSEYTLLILCWEDRPSGKCYSLVQSPKTTVTFKAFKEDHFFILPGFDFGKIPPKQSVNFKIQNYHFGTIDFNFESALQQFLVLKSPLSTKNKVLITGSKGEVIEVVDANGAFEQN